MDGRKHIKIPCKGCEKWSDFYDLCDYYTSFFPTSKTLNEAQTASYNYVTALLNKKSKACKKRDGLQDLCGTCRKPRFRDNRDWYIKPKMAKKFKIKCFENVKPIEGLQTCFIAPVD